MRQVLSSADERAGVALGEGSYARAMSASERPTNRLRAKTQISELALGAHAAVPEKATIQPCPSPRTGTTPHALNSPRSHAGVKAHKRSDVTYTRSSR